MHFVNWKKIWFSSIEKSLEKCYFLKITYCKFSKISANLGISATIIILQNVYWEILATLDLPLVAITLNIGHTVIILSNMTKP